MLVLGGSLWLGCGDDPVIGPEMLSGLHIAPKVSTIETGDTVRLELIGSAVDADRVEWAVSPDWVATVEDGHVVGRGLGQAVVRASDGVRSDSAVVNVVAPGEGAPSAPAPKQCRNEPSGFVSFESQDWGEKPPLGGWGASEAAKRRLKRHEDAAAPASPPRTLRGVFVRGFSAGSAPFSTGYELLGSQRVPRIYVCQWTRHSSNFVNHPTGSKHLWFMLEDVSGWNGATSVYSAHDGPDMRVQINLQNQPWGNRNLTPNTGDRHYAYMKNFLGRWVQYEYLLELNSEGRANGRVRVWVNGERIIDYKDVQFVRAGDPRRWTRVRWQPTYGGVGGRLRQNQYQDMDHIYISGAR